VFVYGTLKTGQSNHERFCRGLLSAREATVRGRLYELPFGFPSLVVPEEDVYTTGTTNYLTDAEEQHRTPTGLLAPLPGWDLVHGELLTFGDPERRLPTLDTLEGFRPGEKSFYSRILVPAVLVETGETVLAWTYTAEPASGVYLPDGRWPAA
jgi:gamma-glutamylcyclotransferase (GGCT)/AIG2-like uncharacterized protein YtfP